MNGHHIGRHVGGFTGFEFDITHALRWTGPNLLAVRVNDVLDPTIAPANETNVPGYGGIYRSVLLMVTDPLRVRPNGAWVTAERAGNGMTLRVRTWVGNPNDASRQARLETLLVDTGGQPVATAESSAALEAGEVKEFDQRTDVLLRAFGHCRNN